MDFNLNKISYKILRHVDLQKPSISKGSNGLSGNGFVVTTHSVKDQVVSISTNIAIYLQERDEILTVEQMTDFNVPPDSVAERQKETNALEYYSLLGELYLVHQSLILGNLLGYTETHEGYQYFLQGQWSTLYDVIHHWRHLL